MQLAVLKHPGILAALGSAVLFGAATPLAKALLDTINPWMLASLLYLGSGIGLSLYRHAITAAPVTLAASERIWFAGAIASGGVVGPVLLMIGLKGSTASATALLLNMEGVFTALLAWFAFKENFDRQIALGMLAIVAGAVILSWPGEARFEALWPSLAILGACFAWGIDNNLTRKVSLSDASWIAMVKGLVAGSINLLIALSIGAALPSVANAFMAMLIGLFAYGISLVLFVIGLRHLGTARTGAYFSIAPMFGASLAVVVLGEAVTVALLLAGSLMTIGLWLHLREIHDHLHTHDELTHEHEHTHDEHHSHLHDSSHSTRVPHTHRHTHSALTHSHHHYPDLHHPHRH